MPRSLVALRFGGLTVALVGTLACGDGDSQAVEATIGPDGGVLRSADGVLSISIRPGALAEDTLITLIPVDELDPAQRPPAVFGPAYRIRPDVDLELAARVTYYHGLPDDPENAAIGVVLREEFEAGKGRWHALPTTRLEPDAPLIAATDERLSMYYGLLDTAGPPDGSDESSGGGSTDDGGTSEEPEDDSGSGSTGDPPGTTSDDGAEASTDDGGTESGTDTGTSEVECDNLYAGPYEVEHLGVILPGSEDIAMTGNGSFVGRNGAAMTEVFRDGMTMQRHAGLMGGQLGTRIDLDGNIVWARDLAEQRAVLRLVGGNVEEVLSVGEVNRANGLYPDSQGRVWVTDFGANTIIRVDEDLSFETVALNQFGANGIVYDEDRGVLFWSLYGNSTVWRAPVEDDGSLGAAVMVTDLAGNTDGLSLDACGNLYAVDQANFQNCRLERLYLTSDGALDASRGDEGIEELAGAGTLGVGCSNAQFGFGFDDERDESLFVTAQSGNVYTVFVGVPGQPIAPVR